ncbi:MAG: IPT/TIG domain-containing protein [Terriglobia bacterium]
MQARLLVVVAGAFLLASLARGQATPRVSGVEPSSGKVDSNLTVTGENLGKETVADVYLSDEMSDYKATVVEQTAAKIVVKVPEVKPGGYNVSIHVGNNIFIQPVRFTVEQ